MTRRPNSVLLRTLRAERARLDARLADTPLDSARHPNLTEKVRRLTEAIRAEIDGPAVHTESTPGDNPTDR